MNNVFLKYKIIFYLFSLANLEFSLLAKECKRFNRFIPFFMPKFVLKFH